MNDVRYGREILAAITALCEAEPEREACGLVVSGNGGLEAVPVPNVADREHARDPLGFPRTSRESYLMDPHAQLRVLKELEDTGGSVVAVWHSHVEAGAYFSAKDRADALQDGAPLVPGAEYLVFGVQRGRVTEAKRFVFRDGDFVEAPLA